MTLRERLRAGAPVVALFSVIPVPAIAELAAHAGFDAIVLDTEHGPIGPESLDRLVPVARAAGIYPLIRVRENDASLIGAALDVGAAGVVVPQINSGESAAAAVAAARFSPLGHRGANPYVRSAHYAGTQDYFARANEEVAVIVMIEGKAGIDALDDILAVPEIDAVFVGPFDLSQSLGVPGQTDHPMVVDKMKEIVARATDRRVAAGVFAPTAEAATRWRSLGVRFISLGFDSALALDGLRRARAALP
ncbi:MAG: aldolase/citrate lyase family protein [Gemmatimonadaceae bacterium]